MLPGLAPTPTPELTEALALIAQVATCPDCEAQDGLCDRHRWEVLPQLAKPAWVRLMGSTMLEEQASLQDIPPERAEAHRLAVLRYVEALAKGRRMARANARKRERARIMSAIRPGLLPDRLTA